MQFIIPALILLAFSPFLWLYEQIGPEWFWGVPAGGVVIRQWRHQSIRKLRVAEKAQQAEALKLRKAKEQREFAAQIGRRALEKRQEREEKQARQSKSKEPKQTMKNFELLMAFIAATLNKMPDDWGAPRELSGMEVIEALWPLNDVFRPRMSKIGALPYDASLEIEADQAIEAFIYGEGETAWDNLSPGTWRVLCERHTQALVVASANEAAGNPLMTIPEDLPEYAWLCAAMLYLMYQMKLPYPVKPRSVDELPPAGSLAMRVLH